MLDTFFSIAVPLSFLLIVVGPVLLVWGILRAFIFEAVHIGTEVAGNVQGSTYVKKEAVSGYKILLTGVILIIIAVLVFWTSSKYDSSKTTETTNGTATTSVVPNTQTYSDSDISFVYPDNWIAQKPSDPSKTSARVFVFTDSNQQNGVVAYIDSYSGSLQDYIASAKQSYEKSGGTSFTKETNLNLRDASNNLVPAYESTMTAQSQGTITNQEMILTVHNGKSFAIIASASNDVWPSLLPNFEQVLTSISLK